MLDLIQHGAMPRSVLAQRSGRSLAQVGRVVAELLDAGMLVEHEARAAAAGRPVIPLEISADTYRFVGVKLGGADLHAVVTDLRGQILDSTTVPLASTDVGDVVATIAATIRELGAAHPRVLAAGISIGAHIVDRRMVSRAAFLQWEDVDLAGLVERAVAIPVWVENDVRALTQVEHWYGEGRGRDSFAVFTIGTGLGLGLVTNGAIIDGADHTAGSIGHQYVGDSGAVCEYGHVGCARAHLTTPFVLRRAHDALGHEVTINELVVAAAAGQPRAREVTDEIATIVGRLLADVANITNPGLVILTGESAALLRPSMAAVHAEMDRRRHWITVSPEVRIASFDFREWARGAAAVAIQMRLMGPDTARSVPVRLPAVTGGGAVRSPGAGLPVGDTSISA